MSSTGQCYYQAARDEINCRMRLRDQIILSFIIASSAIMGIALGKIGVSDYTVVLVIPFIALGTTILVATHTSYITKLGSYAREIVPAINECRRQNTTNDSIFIEMNPWDTSNTFQYIGKDSSRYRLYAQLVIFFVPSAYALILYAFGVGLEGLVENKIQSVIWGIGILLILFNTVILFLCHNNRVNSIDKMQEDLQTNKYDIDKQLVKNTSKKYKRREINRRKGNIIYQLENRRLLIDRRVNVDS